VISNNQCDYLLFDISSILYRTFFVHKQENDETIVGLATHVALTTLNKYFKQYKPKKVVMSFDRASWRKEYTASEQCVSKRPYKGNRRKDMSPAQQAKYARFLNHLNEFEALIGQHSTIISLAADKLESDDLVAGFVQAHPDKQIVIISSDGDFLQLLKNPNVTLVTPENGKARSLEEYNNNADYFLFFKCIRGDHTTDNIQSALPNVSTVRIQKAYKDPFEQVKIMKETWRDENKREFMVEKLYKENQLLIDLEKQPTEIRELITKTIQDAENKPHKFSMFHLMRFLGKYKLEKIAENIVQFVPLLSR